MKEGFPQTIIKIKHKNIELVQSHRMEDVSLPCSALQLFFSLKIKKGLIAVINVIQLQ